MCIFATTKAKSQDMKASGPLRIFIFCILQSVLINAYAQKILKQTNISKAGIQPGNYSGITYLGNNLYAIVDDKNNKTAFETFEIMLNPENGKIDKITSHNQNISVNQHSPTTQNDAEGITYCNTTKTIFICSESEQTIKEFTIEGKQTGRELSIPKLFSKENIQKNRGFEALTYSTYDSLFWTVTESELITDKDNNQLNGQKLRIQSFGLDLQPKKQYAYLTDKPTSKRKGKEYAHGISSLLALEDGRLIVLEREIKVSNYYIGSYSKHKLFVISPTEQNECSLTESLKKISPDIFIQKKEICSFNTRLRIGKINFANYEGMCLGPKLNDGRQTIILINDSQSRKGNKYYRLKDYLKVIILPHLF